MKSTFGRRGLSLFLALVMCLTMIPAVFAEDGYAMTLTPPGALTAGGEKGTVTVHVTKDGAGVNVDAADITWESSATSVATVANGEVTPLSAGTTTITATYTYTLPDDPDPDVTPDPDAGQTRESKGTVTATCDVTVNAATVTPTSLDVQLSDTELDIVARSTVPLSSTVTPIPAYAELVNTRLTYQWSSSNTKVVSITSGTQSMSAAMLLAEGAGEATVTLRVSYGATVVGYATCKVYVSPKMDGVSLNSYSGTTDVRKQIEVTARPTPEDEIVTWTSSDTTVATVGSTDANGHRGIIYGVKPGKATITATIGSGDNMEKADYVLTVSGLVIEADDYPVIKENETELLPVVHRYGAASTGTLSWQSSNPTVAQISGSSVAGRGPGTATITAYAGTYEASFNVTVTSNNEVTLELGSMRVDDTLKFSRYLEQIAAQAPGGLSHVTGLSVPTSQGTLFYKYTSADEPNEGVAQNGSYYYSPKTGQKGLGDITFVPNPTYGGGTVTINYTVVSKTNQNYSCRIIVEIAPNDGTNMTLSATNLEPAWLNSTQFNEICNTQTGNTLDYVIFSLPPSNQGTLYADFVNTGNYGEIISAGAHYSRKELDKIAFVPADGYTGTVNIYYTARSLSGVTFSGRITINVRRESTNGGSSDLCYNVPRGGVVTFDDANFNEYRKSIMSGSSTLNYVRFDALPSYSQGVLYYNYRSANNMGSQVTAGTSYYYGSRNPRLDMITFVPAEDFYGVVRIPFTGWDNNGSYFTGEVEINVKGGGSGDILYTCGPGRTVDFKLNDFTSLCRDLTGQSLKYISFQDLPSQSYQGSLYHNNSRISSTGRLYYNNSGTYQIKNLSFRASSSFSGEVNIPFEGHASNGEIFNGVITIESVDYGSERISYNATSKDPAVFERGDFDELAQWETRHDISSVKFDIPSSSQGDLYRNYSSMTSKGSKITSSSTSITASSLNRVAFIPAAGFTGTVYIDFTATAASGGGTFTGTVEIIVDRPGADVTANFSTRVSPVSLQADKLRRSGYTLSSIRFTSMPSSREGYLYYRYTSPTQYDRQAGTNASYNVSGSSLISDLTFVPRAGFTGTVVIPYVGTNSNKSTFEGEVVITVSPTYTSAYFNDVAGYSNDQKAAIDYLYEAGITTGISATQYGPQMNISRADFAVMIYRTLDLSPVSTNYFYDVPSNTYYTQAINTLHSIGVVNGVGNGAYAPQDPVNRQDAICMVQRVLRYIGWSSSDGNAGILSGYSDGYAVSNYAQGAMANAVLMGYLPLSGGQLAPKANLTRVDMATILHRVLTY